MMPKRTPTPAPNRFTTAAHVSIRTHHLLLGGLLILAVLIPLFFSPLYPDYNLPKRALTELLVALLTVLWLIGMARRKYIVLESASLYVPILIFLGLNALSLFWANNRTQGLDMLAQYAALFIVPILVLHIVRTPRHVRILASAMAFTGGVVGLIGLLQYNAIASFYTREVLPVSTIGNTSFVAEYYNVVFPLALALIFVFQNAYLRTGAVLASLLISGHLIILGSRGGWLGALITLALFAIVYLIKYPQIRHVLRRAVVALIFILAGWSVLEDLFNADQLAATYWERVLGRVESAVTITDDATRQRISLWRDTAHMIAQAPLLGVGVGNFEYQLPRFTSRESHTVKTRLERANKNVLMAFRAHNEYLEIWAETGILGLLAFAFLLFTIARNGRALLRRHLQNHTDLLSVGLIAALTATTVHACFSMNLQNPVSSLSFWLVVGLIFAANHMSKPNPPLAHWPLTSTGPTYRIAAAGALLFIAVFAFEVQTLIGSYYYHLGALWLKQDRPADAQAAFTRALKYRVPQAFLAYQGLGVARLEQQRAPEAVTAFRESLLRHPNNPTVLRQLIHALETAGRPREALSPLQHAITLDPGNIDLRIHLARILFHLGELRQARQALQNAQTISQNIPDDLNKVALAYLEHQDAATAQSLFQNLISRVPQNPEYQTNLGYAHLQQGHPDSARTAYQTAIDHNPKYARAYLLLGDLLVSQNDLKTAQKVYQQGLKRNPRNRDLQTRLERINTRFEF